MAITAKLNFENSIFPEAPFEALEKVLRKWPSEFEQDLIHDFQRFQILSERDFKAPRKLRHQIRIVCSHYLMLKKMLRRKWVAANQLDLELRLLPTNLQFTFGQKPVLGIAIVIHLSSPYERFEDQHILLAAQKLIPGVQAVKESFWAYQKPRELYRLLYLEIEKEIDSTFTITEIRLLKQNLKDEFKKHVETLSPSTFGNYDVEETMRNIYFLSQEIRSRADLPQVMICFEKALATTLVFKVIVLRTISENSAPIAECFHTLNEDFEYVLERSSIIGQLESNTKFSKEANVFRLHIPKKSSFLRSDLSFNLYRARQYVYSLVTQAIGNIRDYNGGIFAKQLELFAEFKNHFSNIAEQDCELLEDFFHSIYPPELQAILSPNLLTNFFELFLKAREESLPQKESAVLEVKHSKDQVYAIARFREKIFQEKIQNILEENGFTQECIAWLNMADHEITTLGYIYQGNSPEKRKKFEQTLNSVLQNCVEQVRSTQILRLTQEFFPVSLDPRLGGDLYSENILKMLYEGLMTLGKDGKLQYGIAKNVEISADYKKFTFTLKNCFWSNGDRITAHDFCFTWKKILSPAFKSSFTYLFYVIMNARKAKEGAIPPDQLGIQAVDDETLIVQLEHPCIYFLELTAHPLYSPVNQRVDQLHPNWPLQTGTDYVCNGPFVLEHFDRQEGFELKKNPMYWDRENIRIDEIRISKANGHKSLDMFQKGEIDWFGHPFRVYEFPRTQKNHYNSDDFPFNSTYWFIFNVKTAPFQSRKIRQALSYAIDKKAILEMLPYRALPAFTPLQLIHSQFPDLQPERDIELARKLFQEGLDELGLTIDTLPSITLSSPDIELRKKIAQSIAQQWKKVLGININMDYFEFSALFHKMTAGNYQIGAIRWTPRIDDPLYTLDAFRSKDEQINLSNWENPIFKKQLRLANKETNIEKRNEILRYAERILIDELPAAPIYHSIQPSFAQHYLEEVVSSRIGTLDFKYVHINKEKKYANRNKFPFS